MILTHLHLKAVAEVLPGNLSMESTLVVLVVVVRVLQMVVE